MLKIDISTEEKQKEVYALFDGMSKKGDIFEYYGVSDNAQNTKELVRVGKEIGFDFSIYHKRKYPDRFCKVCGKKLSSGQYEFCSRSCSATYTNSHRVVSEDSRKKRAETLRQYYKDHLPKKYTEGKKEIELEDGSKVFMYEHACLSCGKVFYSKKREMKFCSKECATINRSKMYRENLDEYKIYHHACDFKFALNDFPDEFDFTLIEEYGWYKPKNHGNNLNGVSRDHIFSVREGFENHIDPYYLSHPVNCRLMIHNDNISKHKRSDLTFEELVRKVKEWNNKYGEYKNIVNYDGVERFRE